MNFEQYLNRLYWNRYAEKHSAPIPFGSAACNNNIEGYEGMDGYRNSEYFRRVTETVLIANEFKCCICDKHNALSAHHLYYLNQSIWGLDTEDNLVPICKTCHNNLHSYIDYMYRKFGTNATLSRADAKAHLLCSGIEINPDKAVEIASFYNTFPTIKDKE